MAQSIDFAKTRLEETIEAGRQSATTTINKIFTEIPSDTIRPASELAWSVDDTSTVSLDGAPLHDHALGQVASRSVMPIGYARKLLDVQQPWSRDLVAHSLREIYHNDPAQYLVRSVGGQVRGFLSDRYRRLDSRPIVESFCGVMDLAGAVPSSGHASDTRISIRGILPTIHEPTPGEYMAFGVDLTNSDFGNGALTVRSFALRLVCLNGMVGTDDLRQIHLGKRLDLESFSYSARTLELDTEATTSAVRDVAGQLFDTRRIEKYMDQIRASASEKLSAGQIASRLKALSKPESKNVIDAYSGPDQINMPPGESSWRLANAISWIAKSARPERAIEMEEIAGRMIAA